MFNFYKRRSSARKCLNSKNFSQKKTYATCEFKNSIFSLLSRFLARCFRYFNFLTTYWRPRSIFINTGTWLGTLRYFNYLTTYWRPRSRFINTGSWLVTSGTSTTSQPTGDLEIDLSIQVPG